MNAIVRPLLQILAGFSLAATGVSAGAQATENINVPSAVVAIVTIPVPAGFSREKIVAVFEQQAPLFERMPGLLRKYFTVSADTTLAGGVYLWKDRAAAEHYYTDAWRANVLKSFGSAPSVTYFDSPVQIVGPHP